MKKVSNAMFTEKEGCGTVSTCTVYLFSCYIILSWFLEHASRKINVRAYVVVVLFMLLYTYALQHKTFLIVCYKKHIFIVYECYILALKQVKSLKKRTFYILIMLYFINMLAFSIRRERNYLKWTKSSSRRFEFSENAISKLKIRE